MSAAAPAAEETGVLGGGVLPVADYAAFLDAEYLAAYLPAGGSAVKVAVVGDEDVARRFTAALIGAATARRALALSLSAADTKVHMVDQVYFAVARRVDWPGLAAAYVRAAYDEAALPAPSPTELSVAAVARHHDLDARELYRSVRRRLEHRLLNDHGLAPEMRRAMLRLAQAQLRAGDIDREEHNAVLAWLRGELRSVTALRPALIYTRIARHNARAMLASLARLLHAVEHPGLVLVVDYGRLAESRRPPAGEREGVYYSKAATLDAYEVLRQLIDATDELCGMLTVALVRPEQMSDENRGLFAYSALRLRVADEVRDRRRPNPYAALARLEVRLEAVP